MPADVSEQSFEFSGAYRSARAQLTVGFGVSIAWAISAVDVGSEMNAGSVSVVLRQDWVAALLLAVVAYLLFRLTIDFCMMPPIIRRRRLARVDFRVATTLGRIGLLAVCSAMTLRSLSSVLCTLAITLGLIVASVVVAVVVMFLMLPVIIRVRQTSGKRTLAAFVEEAEAWALLLTPTAISLGLTGALTIGWFTGVASVSDFVAGAVVLSVLCCVWAEFLFGADLFADN